MKETNCNFKDRALKTRLNFTIKRMHVNLVLYITLLVITSVNCTKRSHILQQPQTTTTAAAPAPATPTLTAATLPSPHPRILLTDTQLATLKQQAVTDPLLTRYVNDVLYVATKYTTSAQPVYSTSDILPVSQDCLDRIMHLGLAYRWTNDVKYAAAAKTLLTTISNFPSWNPTYFLDVAEMTNAAAMGYDWFYTYLDATTRQKLETAILNYGIKPYFSLMLSNPSKISSLDNWNLVCNGGIMMGALAVKDIYPTDAQNVINQAVKNLPVALTSYAPDGAWYEGPGYWRYATEYAVNGIAGLTTATGSDQGLSSYSGLNRAGDLPIFTIAPSGYPLNYADTFRSMQRGDLPKQCLFWLGTRFANPMYINSEHSFLVNRRADPKDVIYYAPKTTETTARPLDKFFDGIVPLAIFRSAWNDSQALYLGAKAGSNNLAHCHLDLGSFELEALGVRWAADLGADDYNLPGYWDRVQGGKRWTYYRMNSHSHNVPMINYKDQLIAGLAKVTSYLPGTDPSVTMDLTSAYSQDASSVTRQIKLYNSRQNVQVTDNFTLLKQSDIYWGMTTPATITILSGGKATLTKDGKTLYCQILSPAGANFYTESAAQPAPQQPNTGYSRLMVKANVPAGAAKIVIALMTKP